MTDLPDDTLRNKHIAAICEIVGSNPIDLTDTEKDQIYALTQDAVNEARREELKYWQWKTDGHIELSGKQVDDRLAALTKGETDGNR